MDDAPLPNIDVTPKKTISETIEIHQENKTYKLMIEIEERIMKIKIIEDDPFLGSYSRIFTLGEIKELHQVFSMLNSFKEFLDYFKALSNNKKITIKQTDERFSINMTVEYLLKQNTIEINLTPEEINFKLVSKELKNEIILMKNKINDMENKYQEIIEKQKEYNDNLVEENNKFKNRIKLLEDENNNIKDELNKCINMIKEIKAKKNDNNKEIILLQKKINSSIMESDEFDLIESAIK